VGGVEADGRAEILAFFPMARRTITISHLERQTQMEGARRVADNKTEAHRARLRHRRGLASGNERSPLTFQGTGGAPT
jgi:hypothetical protein